MKVWNFLRAGKSCYLQAGRSEAPTILPLNCFRCVTFRGVGRLIRRRGSLLDGQMGFQYVGGDRELRALLVYPKR